MSIKFKIILPSVVLTLLVFAMFLGTVFTLSLMSADSLKINLAGRQRMLIQKMTKEFLI